MRLVHRITLFAVLLNKNMLANQSSGFADIKLWRQVVCVFELIATPSPLAGFPLK